MSLSPSCIFEVLTKMTAHVTAIMVKPAARRHQDRGAPTITAEVSSHCHTAAGSISLRRVHWPLDTTEAVGGFPIPNWMPDAVRHQWSPGKPGRGREVDQPAPSLAWGSNRSRQAEGRRIE